MRYVVVLVVILGALFLAKLAFHVVIGSLFATVKLGILAVVVLAVAGFVGSRFLKR